jgi:hypothetical protein
MMGHQLHRHLQLSQECRAATNQGFSTGCLAKGRWRNGRSGMMCQSAGASTPIAAFQWPRMSAASIRTV